jgi:penicillin-binding protein 1A
MAEKGSKPVRWKKWLKVAAITTVTLSAIGGVMVGGGIYYLSKDLPSFSSLEGLKRYEPKQATRVFSDDGQIIGQFYTEKRVFVPLTEMPQEMFQAILAVEDARFYEHHGFDTRRIIIAFLKNIQGLKVKQGASTITQQLTRALFLTPEKTFTRKIKELLLARKIESVLTKDEILELYLNQIYFGEGAYGVQMAAKTYFGKEISEISLEEAAFLAGIPKAPNNYSPYRHPKEARGRQLVVLRRMRQEGYITGAQYAIAQEEGLVFKEKDLGENLAPYFNEYLRQYFVEQYGADLLYKGGLNVYTSLNTRMQEVAESALQKGLIALDQRQGYRAKLGLRNEGDPLVEGAVVVLDAETGGVKAMVGGYDFRRSEFNRAVQARRQPGSAFKPIIFGAAIKAGFTPASIVVDNPVIFRNQVGGKVWKPQNYGEKFYGPISIREALTHSRNLAAIDLLKQVGVGPTIDFARLLGIKSPLAHDLSLALGSSSVTLLELTSAYSVFANKGIRMPPSFFTSVEDPTGHVLEQTEMNAQQVVFEETAFVVTNMLENVIRSGTGRRANVLKQAVAGKTGTTNDFIDAWFIGYTPDLVVGVWVGFDDRRPLGDSESGGSAALPIWLDFMQTILPEVESKPFVAPENIVYAKIDPSTGLLSSDPENGAMEVFVKGTEPKEYRTDLPKPGRFFEWDEEEPAEAL